MAKIDKKVKAAKSINTFFRYMAKIEGFIIRGRVNRQVQHYVMFL